MSYTNGIGSAQHFPGAAEAAAASSANRPAKAAPASVSGQGFGGSSPVDEARLSSTASAVAQALSEGDVRTDKVAALAAGDRGGNVSVSLRRMWRRRC